MKLTKYILVIATLAVITGCAIVNVGYDQDNSADFTHYKTFAWYAKDPSKTTNSTFDNQILESNIKNLVSGQLKRCGFTVDVTTPDLLLDYDFMVQNKVDQQQVPIYSQAPVYAHPYNYAYNGGAYYNGYNNNYNNGYNNAYNYGPTVVGYQTVSIPYKDGTLTISAVDRKTNNLVWRGWAEGALTDEQTYESELPQVIQEIFKKFPISPPKKSKNTKK